MASQVVNLLSSGFGAVTKPSAPAPAKAARDDQFSRLLDAPANTAKRGEAPAAASAPASNETKPASAETASQDTPETTETVAAAPTDKATETEDTAAVGTENLADALLAALAALGLTSEAPTETGEVVLTEAGEAAPVDPAALKNIEDSLKDLSELLGMDVATLMQQLSQLAKTVSAEGGGEAELSAKLNAFVGERLAAIGVAPDATVEASIAKLIDGLGQFAKPVPTEPALASAQLKLPEPVLAATTGETEKPTEPELKVDPTSIERKPGSDKPEQADASQNRNANAGQQAARPNGGQENPLNLVPTGPAAAPADAATPQVDAAATPRVVQTGYQTSQQQLNLPQIAFELSRQVGDGNTRFQIRLDPAELGRIDVKLDIDKNGQVHARLTVEKAETLDLMQRDQRALEKALQQAGLDQSKTNLEFSLKQNPFAGDQNQRSGDERSGSGNSQDSQEETEVSAPAITLYRGALQASGLNILA